MTSLNYLNLKSKSIIRDGQTRLAYIAPYADIHGAFAFEYRPLLPDQSIEIERAVGNASDGGARLMASCIAKQCQAWSETDDKGEMVSIDAKSVLKMPYMQFMRIYHVIVGVRGGDPLPNASEETKDETSDYLKSLEEKPAVSVEAEAKN